MEDLVTTITQTFISSEDVVNLRKSLFKYNGLTEVSARDKRRARLLEDYKLKRDAILNEKRGLIEDNFSDNEDWMDWEDAQTRRNEDRRGYYREKCRGQLMLSEWLLDRPCDIEKAWTVVVCPEGQRTLVIANKGCTRAYHKKGILMAKFPSILPFGSPARRGKRNDIIILDCIWNAKNKMLFALDVLFWRMQPLLSCDADFRMYWLRTKISELKKYDQPLPLGEGVYDVHLPSHCTLSTLPAVLADHNPSEVDGILFYHNGAPYISGQTPLVGWLKPYMLPERFGVQVPQEYLEQRPQNYENLEQWVEKVSHKHSKQNQEKKVRRRKRKGNKDKMELDSTEASTSSSVVAESSVCEMSEGMEETSSSEVTDSSLCEMSEGVEQLDSSEVTEPSVCEMRKNVGNLESTSDN
uniref:Snurportin-1 n=1 Tax=Homalodisca liturata TaxID=320908 RepID=A0A1B6H8I1_9HEMI